MFRWHKNTRGLSQTNDKSLIKNKDDLTTNKSKKYFENVTKLLPIFQRLTTNESGPQKLITQFLIPLKNKADVQGFPLPHMGPDWVPGVTTISRSPHTYKCIIFYILLLVQFHLPRSQFQLKLYLTHSHQSDTVTAVLIPWLSKMLSFFTIH